MAPDRHVPAAPEKTRDLATVPAARPIPMSEGLIGYGEARQRVDRAIEDAVAAVGRKVGVVRGAGSIPEPWVRMIARDAARLALGMQINPDRPESEHFPCLVVGEVDAEFEAVVPRG